MILLALLVTALDPSGSLQGQPTRASEQSVEWNWGELIYGRTYAGVLTIRNTCSTERRILIVNDEVPGLLIRPVIALPPRSSVRVPYTITLQPGTPQQLTDTIKGEVVAWHSGDAGCPALRSVHAVAARVRTPTFQDVEHASSSADRAAVLAACGAWWVKGRNPTEAIANGTLPGTVKRAVTGLDEQRCASEVRLSARELRRQSATADAARNPTAWRWLPSDAAIDRFTMAELIEFRRRVLDLRAKER